MMFAEWSGLEANPSKSQIIVSKAAWDVKQQLLNVLGFWEGTLPVRYLGVPLISSRLTAGDCAPLLRKVDERLQGWSKLQLSFAAGVQLLRSVIMSLNIYWAMAFVLPRSVIKVIEARMRRFLLHGIPLDATLQHVIRNGNWDWPEILDVEHNEIIHHLPVLNAADKISWNSSTGQFTTTAAYQIWQPRGPKCLRSLRVEVRYCIPRFDWIEIIEWASRRWKSRHPINAVHKALLASLVYHIWMERNRRIFTTDSRTAQQTAHLCIAQLRLRIIGVDFKFNVATAYIFRVWKIPWHGT
ncbi:UNVERIFIED_CONTAM: hypothetical protein Slati_2206600 [Sesamum latifolium]|uniref:Reverse transcriptase n=1 Tax=Sesamum latifolium TaxID=2727402 RepID=A0AAW2WV80_9LAMI